MTSQNYTPQSKYIPYPANLECVARDRNYKHKLRYLSTYPQPKCFLQFQNGKISWKDKKDMIPCVTAFPAYSCSHSSSNLTLFSICLALNNTRNHCLNRHKIKALFQSFRHNNFYLRVTSESSTRTSEVSTEATREADKIVDGMDFGELCNEFECISSPSVEATSRQLARDILELREGNRALGTFAISVKYRDPVRSFTGREKYKRPLWATDALENPRVSVQQMAMLSTSVLNINWTIRGKPRSLFSVGGDLIIKVNSKFILNQISGQVIEHEETWDLSASSLIAQLYFWTSKRLYATVEAGKDVSDFIKDLTNRFQSETKNAEIYPDPTGDPTKFFQKDDGFQRDFYQVALFLAVVYFVIQFLKTTL